MIRKVPDSDEPAEQAARGQDERPVRRAARAGRGPRAAEAAATGTPGDDARAGGGPADAAADPDEREPGAGPHGPRADDPHGDGVPDGAGGSGESFPAAREGDGVAADAPAARSEGAPCDRPLALRLEAVLFASGQALSAARLAKVLDADGEAVRAALEGLAGRWQQLESAIELVEISGGWRFMTRTPFHPDLAGLAKKGKVEHLSPAALETLAVVAYRQPIGRADVEAVRGVQSGPLLRVLLDRDLIRIVGRSKEPGHPLLYGTTRRFLDHFGLKSLKELPDLEDLLDVS